jgi:hypothetical protein
MMLIPIMSGSEGTVATTSEGTVEGEKQDSGVGIIMIASTVRVYASGYVPTVSSLLLFPFKEFISHALSSSYDLFCQVAC